MSENVTSDKVAAAFGIFVLTCLFLIPASLLRGWVINTMWGWFVLPAFGFAAPGIAVCIGLSFFVHLFTSSRVDNDQRHVIEKLLTPIMRDLFTLGFGWLVTLFL